MECVCCLLFAQVGATEVELIGSFVVNINFFSCYGVYFTAIECYFCSGAYCLLGSEFCYLLADGDVMQVGEYAVRASGLDEVAYLSRETVNRFCVIVNERSAFNTYLPTLGINGCGIGSVFGY